MIKTSTVTGKTYDTDTAIYMTNPKQFAAYLKFIGDEPFVDVVFSSKKGENALAFVWLKCPETKKAKELWDQHLL